LHKSEFSQNFGDLFDLIVSQAFDQSLDKNTQGFGLERRKLSLEEMVQVARHYTNAHPTFDCTNENFIKGLVATNQ
jgi:hypothetical protein